MGSLVKLITISIMAFQLVSTPRSSVAQQPYVGQTTTDCTNDHNSTSTLGYFCNGLNATCHTFLTFRSTVRHRTVASISSLLASNPAELAAANSVNSDFTFPPSKLILVPISCSCDRNYQHNASYAIAEGDTYYLVAHGTFQGLSTCQAIQSQPENPAARELSIGSRISVPLRCACPTKRQSDLGFKYLMSYVVPVGDTISAIAARFGASVQSILDANSLSETDTIIDFTTLLIPLENPPTSDQTVEIPVPITPTREPSPPSSSENENKNKNKAWIYALVGAIGGVAFLVVLVFVLYCKVLSPKKKERNGKKKPGNEKNDPILASESFESKKTTEEQYSRDFLEAMTEIAQTIKVYSFEDLNKATSGFSSKSLIKNSVYRASINGDTAAIKRFDGDISKELNLLQKINHFNVIRLSGVAFNEGHWYLVYEYASNGPLSDHLFRSGEVKLRSLSWTQRIQIALDIATGLNYLHSFSNPSHVHKDIKSSNVLLDSDFRAKIANFGLARSSSKGQDGQFEMTKHVVGTVGYMAPEYLEHGLVSTKLDVYAFGVVLLEMITGKEVSELYEDNKKLGDVYCGDFGRFVDVSLGEKYPGEIIGFVVKIIDSCLKKNVEARPSMDEIVQLLSITLSNSLTWESSQA